MKSLPASWAQPALSTQDSLGCRRLEVQCLGMRGLEGKPGAKVLLTGQTESAGDRAGYRHPFTKAVYLGNMRGPGSPGGLCSVSVEHGALR